MKHRHFIIITIIFIAAALAAVIFKSEPKAVPLPIARPYEEPKSNAQPNHVAGSSLPAEVNLAIPFTSQAPYKNWDEVHEEFCEEASVLMAAHYIKHLPIPSPKYADEQLFKIKDWEERTFGYYKDTTAEETARILKEYYGITNVKLVFDPSVDQIKQAVAEGKTVLVPAAGRKLPNPNYRRPGPLYHMLVIKGYTKDRKFITNDPGTRKGADFIFDFDAVMNAMHDWNGGNVEQGQKVVIVVG